MYGRDPELPTTDMLTGLTHPDGRTEVDFDNYTVKMTARMASMCMVAARDHIQITQSKQKWNYSMTNPRKLHKLPRISEGDHVMLYVLASQAFKFVQPFCGPY